MNHEMEFRSTGVVYGKKRALEGLDLALPSHRVTVIIGPSGCGKSTSLKCLNRLVTPSEGTVLYRGRDILEMEPTALRREMGYAIQNVGLIPHMTVAENVSLVPKLLDWSSERRKERSRELLKLVGLPPEEYGSKYPGQLSGGEAQRVGVARALGADPPVLLMDEPFGAVDPLNREVLQDEFIRIQRKLKKTVVFVTHDLEEALRMADYLVILKDGKLMQFGPPAEILSHPANSFVEKFLGPDRALKRLVLFTADRLMEQGGDCPWELDREGRPIEARIRQNGRDIRRAIDPGSQSVKPHSSLKECMALLLSLGLPSVPVVDEDSRYIGEVRYESIQKLSLE